MSNWEEDAIAKMELAVSGKSKPEQDVKKNETHPEITLKEKTVLQETQPEPVRTITKPLVLGRHGYKYANGRKATKVVVPVYDIEDVRKRGIELGFTSGAIAHYIDYLIDIDLGKISADERIKN